MSIGYRMHRVAVGGCLALLLLASEGHAQSNSYPVGEKAEAQAPATPPAYYEPSCQKPQGAEEANFCIQRRAAEAAEKQAAWNEAQVWLGGLGIALVLGTIWYAKRAADEAGKAAIAALQTLNLTRREFNLLHRPRIRVRNVVIYPTAEGEPINAEAEIANVGDNGAIVFHILYRLEKRTPSGHVMMHGGAISEHIGDDGVSRPVLYPIGAGASILVRLETDLRWDAHLFARLSEWVVVGRVEYRDTYAGDPFDIIARQAHESIERRTAFERPFRRQTASGFVRFARAENPDPEREYED